MAVLGAATGDGVTQWVFAVGIGAACVYTAYLHIKAGLTAETLAPLWKRLIPALVYLAAAFLAANVVFAPGRLVGAFLSDEARRRAGELGAPERIMAVLLVLSALAVFVYAVMAKRLKRAAGPDENRAPKPPDTPARPSG